MSVMRGWRLGACAAVLAARSGAVFGSAAQAQTPPPFDRVAGISADAATGFFQQLRSAVGSNDHARACALIAYPLAHADGVVASAAECDARYDTLFTIDVRKAIGKQVFNELFVNARGIMIGMGEVWIGGRCTTPPCGVADLRIVAINSRSQGLMPPAGKVLLSCRAVGRLIHVTADGANGAEMRLWLSGSAEGTPSVVIAKPTEALRDELCGAREWTFADGTTRYTVSDLSCDAHLQPPPMGSVGELVVRREGQDDVRVWCDQ